MRSAITFSRVLVGAFIASTTAFAGPTSDHSPIIQETMMSVGGSVSLSLDADALAQAGLQLNSINNAATFDAGKNSTFQIIVSNEEFGRTAPGELHFSTGWALSGGLSGSISMADLVMQPAVPGSGYDFAVMNTEGRVLFHVIGSNFDFDPVSDTFALVDAQLRLDVADASAAASESWGPLVGRISATLAMSTVETIVMTPQGVPLGGVLPPGGGGVQTTGGPNQGPDVIVGELLSPAQFGRSGSAVGLAIGTTSCNKGNSPLHWFQMPNTDHPVIGQNLYRLKNDRFEMIGQSWLKHGFTALQQNACGYGCTSGCSGSQLCGGCSDPYDASLNAGFSSLGSRAWVHPFTGFFPSTANNHSGHTHVGTSHRIVVQDADLDPAQNSGALYYFEGQYVTPHEYLPNNGVAHNQYNNVSYKRYTPSGVPGGTWSFSANGSTVREQPAINAWTGSTQVMIEPVPEVDGRAYLAYKVTDLGGGQWHYEYALYNMNLDRSIRSVTIPVQAAVSLTSIEHRGAPQHPAFANDGTQGSAGYSSTPWAQSRTSTELTFATQTFAENQNANAVRWGTLHNLRFDADSPPVLVNATVGFFKTGDPIIVTIMAPAPVVVPCPEDCSGDGQRDQGDLAQLLSCYNVGDCCDINGDGITDQADLAALLAVYNSACP